MKGSCFEKETCVYCPHFVDGTCQIPEDKICLETCQKALERKYAPLVNPSGDLPIMECQFCGSAEVDPKFFGRGVWECSKCGSLSLGESRIWEDLISIKLRGSSDHLGVLVG